MPLADLATTVVGVAVETPPGIDVLFGHECMNMVLALNGKFVLPSFQTIHMAADDPKSETSDMFKLATLAKMAPRG